MLHDSTFLAVYMMITGYWLACYVASCILTMANYSYSTKATHDNVILLHVFPYSVVAGYLRIVLLVI